MSEKKRNMDEKDFELQQTLEETRSITKAADKLYITQSALGDFDGCVQPCSFENGEPFVRKTYLICQRAALALPQVQAFVELLKKYR